MEWNWGVAIRLYTSDLRYNGFLLGSFGITTFRMLCIALINTVADNITATLLSMGMTLLL